MELFDFAAIVGGHIDFSGSFGKENTYVNAHLTSGFGNHAEQVSGCISGSVYGRSENVDLDEALANLAHDLSGKTIRLGKAEYVVPALVHTTGYRGLQPKKGKKRAS